MVWYFVISMLAAFGLLCALWLIFGHLLGVPICGLVICPYRPDRLLRYGMLHTFGFLHCRLLLIDDCLSEKEQAILCQKHPNIEFCRPGDLAARLKVEIEHFD